MAGHGICRTDIEDARHPGLQAGGIERVGLAQRAGHFLLPAARPRRIVAGAEDHPVEAAQGAFQAGVVEHLGDPALGLQIGETLDLRRRTVDQHQIVTGGPDGARGVMSQQAGGSEYGVFHMSSRA